MMTFFGSGVGRLRPRRAKPASAAPKYAGCVFERFTEPARQVVVLAQDEARALKHNYIGTEHILLGLLRENDTVAGRCLEALGVGMEDVRARVARIIGQGDEVAAGQIPFTPRTKRVLELSLREALSLGHDNIGAEHILLGLAREADGVAYRILLDFGADAAKIRNEIIGSLSVEPPETHAAAISQAPMAGPDNSWPFALGAIVFGAALGIGILIGWAIWG